MPLKLNVGLSRKVGEPNFGSRGASVHLELELDSSLVAQPQRLRDRIRQLFRLARAAVDEELNGLAPPGGNGRAAQPHRPDNPGPRPATGSDRPATASQLRALHALAHRRALDLNRLVWQRFGRPPETLSLRQASRLIDELKTDDPEKGERS